MNLAFYKLVEESTAHRLNREFIRDYVIQNPDKLEFLMEIALDENDKIHHKACWSLELIFELKSELILPFLDDFIAKIRFYRLILQNARADFVFYINLSILFKFTVNIAIAPCIYILVMPYEIALS